MILPDILFNPKLADPHPANWHEPRFWRAARGPSSVLASFSSFSPCRAPMSMLFPMTIWVIFQSKQNRYISKAIPSERYIQISHLIIIFFNRKRKLVFVQDRFLFKTRYVSDDFPDLQKKYSRKIKFVYVKGYKILFGFSKEKRLTSPYPVWRSRRFRSFPGGGRREASIRAAPQRSPSICSRGTWCPKSRLPEQKILSEQSQLVSNLKCIDFNAINLTINEIFLKNLLKRAWKTKKLLFRFVGIFMIESRNLQYGFVETYSNKSLLYHYHKFEEKKVKIKKPTWWWSSVNCGFCSSLVL